MKEVANKGMLAVNLTREELTLAVLRQVIFAFFGFVSTRGQALGTFLPFGLAVAGGAPTPFTAASSAGTLIGYILNGGEFSTFRYVAATLAIAAIKILVGTALKKRLKPIFFGCITALVTFCIGVVTVKQDVFLITDALCETAFAGGGAFFIGTAAFALERDEAGLRADELCSVLIAISILVSGLFTLTLGDISAGRIAATVFIMLASRFGGTGTGAVCGTAFGFMALLCGAEPIIIILFSVGGMLSGAFSALGKYAILVSFIISTFAGAAVGKSDFALPFIIETIIGGIVFLLVPKTASVKIGKILSPMPAIQPPTGLKKSVTMRLSFAANALQDVSSTVEQVAKELAKINSPDFSGVLTGIEREACRGCSLRLHCWENKRNDTVSAVIDMTKAVKQGEYNTAQFAPEIFKGRCLRVNAFGDAVRRNYSDYISRISAENRIEEVRSVVSDQFDGISDMLNDLVAEIDKGEVFDNAAALTTAAVLKNIDIRSDECCCKIDKYGRMSIEARVKNTKDIVINRREIMQQLSFALDRDFDIPVITEIGGETMITVSERPQLRVELGVNQIPCSKNSMCGDAYNFFNDGKGRFFMILSDGMGTGGRAAVDGAMASGLMSRLLKSGFGYDCSLRILNSSMLFKSTDESLATVDIAVIDLFTGRTDLFKAGAAPTLVRRSGRTGKAQSSSLPAGILREIGFDKATIRLKKGDILLLLSDGAVNDGTEWICAELEAWGEGSAQELSEHISACASRRRTDNREDDITVMAAIIGKAV